MRRRCFLLVAPSLLLASRVRGAPAPIRHPWLDASILTRTIAARFAPPPGYTRRPAPRGSFAAYLRSLPIRSDRTDVLLYDGSPAPMPSAGVIPLDLGPRDLHQCADTIARLRGEYLWSAGRAEEAAFHFTSGDLSRWSNWRRGRPLVVRGREVSVGRSSPKPETYASYRIWLDRIFTYASTRSLHRDATRVPTDAPLAAGDFFLHPGSPGHVVIIADLALGPNGAQAGLIVQGYIPAREVHVVSPERERSVGGAWFALGSGADAALHTLTWRPFERASAWRFLDTQ